MAIDSSTILNLVKAQGPLIQHDIRRKVNGDSFIIGAMLSELKSRGLLDITVVKKGGSAFYFSPEHLARLENLIEFLNPKDQVTARRLQEEKVLSEATEELFTRVSFRNIPDFAKSFMMQTPQGEYRFWRYYLVPETEARQIVQERFAPKEQAPVQAAQQSTQQGTQQSPEQGAEQSVEETKELLEEKPETQQPDTATQSNEPSQEEQQSAQQEAPREESTTTAATEMIQLKQEEKPPSVKQEQQQNLSVAPKLETTPFSQDLLKYFSTKEITVHSGKQINKDREYSFEITVPTAVGPLRMYAHGRNKKKLNEGDVAAALLKAKNLDLPCLYLHSGEFSKKALRIISKEYNGVILKQV